jgi:hypothetical protein
VRNAQVGLNVKPGRVILKKKGLGGMRRLKLFSDNFKKGHWFGANDLSL